jgi:hypothetical protein
MKIPYGESLTLYADLNLTEVLEVEGVLLLDPKSNVKITTSKNIVVTGDLISQPEATVNHRILFTSIDESKFVGGGDTVLDTDIGMWTIGAGRLNLLGVEQPTFEKGVTDRDTLQQFASTATRNLRIEGTATGQAHIFIKSSRPQTIRYVQLRYLGPRKDNNGDGVKDIVLGRYACHFHHCEDGSRGSIIEGCIARDCNSHVFVPHGSHGITMRNNIVYNVLDAPFWWDYGHMTNDLTWENNLVVNVGYIERANDQDNGGPQGAVSAFVLGFGDGNICRGNVVIGTSGDYRGAGAYNWPEIRDDADTSKDLTSSWVFENNTAINCPAAEDVWQNSEHTHIIRGSLYINCAVPVYHGAYANDYERIDCIYRGGTSEIWAASNTTRRILFINCTFDAQGADYCVLINEGPGVGAAPIMFRNCKFLNFKKKAILDQNPGAGVKKVDIVDCGQTPDKYQISSVAKSGEVIRVQEGIRAWKITKTGTTSIALFAPTNWGTGTGLKAEYFSVDFATKYLERIEPNVNLFDLTHPSPHYLVPTTFAARWTGKIQAQYSEPYNFIIKAGGGFRLWVGDMVKPVLDSWAERYPGEVKSGQYHLNAGQLNDIKLEFFNSDNRSGCTLEWSSTSLKREFVPMSQLYPSGGDNPPPPPPMNQPPVADAGQDQLIAVAFTLFGKGSDPDGTVVAYKWEQVSGPICVIAFPANQTTQVIPSVKGEYVFKLTVTDDKGSTASDEVTVTVK